MLAQIPWGEHFEHEAARALFGANLLVLTWIKGEPMPDGLVGEIVRGLGLERETDEQRRERIARRSTARRALKMIDMTAATFDGIAEKCEEESDCDDDDGVPESNVYAGDGRGFQRAKEGKREV